MTVVEEESEAPSSSEMTSSLSGISGCSKSVLGLEMVISRNAACAMDGSC